MGWGFKTVETPEPEPAEQKPTIEILRETSDQYVTPYVRISGIELTDKHIVAFYRKILSDFYMPLDCLLATSMLDNNPPW